MTARTDAGPPADAGAGGRLLGAGRAGLVLGLFGVMSCVAFESFAVTTVMPVVADALGARPWYSLAFAATIAAGVYGMTAGGTWADRRGPAPPLIGGGVMFLLGVALCAAAPGIAVFVIGRLLQGLGGGIFSVAGYAAIAAAIPPDLRPRMFGLLTAAWLAPAAIGPLVSGLLVDGLHWRAVFLAVLAGSAVSLAVVARVAARLPGPAETPGGEPARAGRWALGAAAGVVCLHLAGQQVGLPRYAGTVLAALAVVITATRLLPRGTFRAAAGVPRYVALRGLFGAVAAGTEIYIPLYLQHERGYRPTAAGAVVAIGALGWAAGAWLQDRRPAAEHPRIVPAALLAAAGPVAVLAVVAAGAPVAVVVAGCLLMGAGMGIAYPQVTSAALAASPAHRIGATGSALQAAEALGAATLLAMTGAVLTGFGRHGYLATYLAVLLTAWLMVVAARAPVAGRSRPGAG